MVVGGDNGMTTKLGDGVGNAPAFTKGQNADLCLKEVYIKPKKDVSCNVMFCEMMRRGEVAWDGD